MLKDKDWQTLSEGQLWYDREGVDSIVIYYVGFLEDVTIEEIEHNYVWFYKREFIIHSIIIIIKSQPHSHCRQRHSHRCHPEKH